GPRWVSRLAAAELPAGSSRQSTQGGGPDRVAGPAVRSPPQHPGRAVSLRIARPGRTATFSTHFAEAGPNRVRLSVCSPAQTCSSRTLLSCLYAKVGITAQGRGKQVGGRTRNGARKAITRRSAGLEGARRDAARRGGRPHPDTR